MLQGSVSAYADVASGWSIDNQWRDTTKKDATYFYNISQIEAIVYSSTHDKNPTCTHLPGKSELWKYINGRRRNKTDHQHKQKQDTIYHYEQDNTGSLFDLLTTYPKQHILKKRTIALRCLLLNTTNNNNAWSIKLLPN